MLRFAMIAVVGIAFAGTTQAQSIPSQMTAPVPQKWSGYWISDKNGHHGPLHAKLRPIDEQTYRATFHGRFAVVVPFWYTTKLHVEAVQPGSVQMGTVQRLPFLGDYRTTAIVTGQQFDATFSSRKDSGRFVMTRK